MREREGRGVTEREGGEGSEREGGEGRMDVRRRRSEVKDRGEGGYCLVPRNLHIASGSG